MKCLVLLLSALLLHILSAAQSDNKHAIDSLFTHLDGSGKVMGAISIFKDGTEVYERAVGFADVENGVPITNSTIFRVGSVSKIFTSVIIMQMVDEGKLSLNTPLSNYFPDIPNASVITVELMLRHRSGLFNFTSHPAYLNWMEQPKSRIELLELFIENGAVFEPDAKTEYSNTNYVLLSFIAEEVDGFPFSQILERRIVKPLNLAYTSYGGPIDVNRGQALSYKLEGRWISESITDMSIPVGAGAIISTPEDLNRFVTALFDGKLVSDTSLKSMTRLVENFGLGLFNMPFYDLRGFGHTGGIDGFQTVVFYLPDDSLSVAMAFNGLDLAMNEILIGVLSLWYDKPYKFPEFSPAIEVNPTEMEKYLGVYSSPSLPIKLAIFMEGYTLFGQGSGQPSFPLEAYEKNKFRFDRAMLKIEFVPEENKLILKQGNAVFELFRE